MTAVSADTDENDEFDKNAYEKKFMKNSTGMLWQYILAKIGANTAENELAKIS